MGEPIKGLAAALQLILEETGLDSLSFKLVCYLQNIIIHNPTVMSQSVDSWSTFIIPRILKHF